MKSNDPDKFYIIAVIIVALGHGMKDFILGLLFIGFWFLQLYMNYKEEKKEKP